MGKRAHPSVNRTNMDFADRRLSVSFLSPKKAPIYILEDIEIRKIAKKVFSVQLMTGVVIERIDAANALLIYIQTHNSNMLVGEDSKHMDVFKKIINKQFINKYKNIQIGLLPGKNINTDVHAIARSIAYAIESTNGTNYMKIARTWSEQVNKNAGLLGIFITISGRIKGGSIASNQKIKSGIVKAQTLTMDIKKAVYHVKTKTGMMGVKVILSRELEDRKYDAFNDHEIRPRNYSNRPYRPFGDNNRDRPFVPRTFDPNRPPRDPNKPFVPRAFDPNRPPRDPNKPFVPRTFDPNRPPRDPNKPFVQRTFDPNRPPRDPNKPFVPRAFDPNRPPRDPNKPFVSRTFDPNRPPRDPNKPFVPRTFVNNNNIGGGL